MCVRKTVKGPHTVVNAINRFQQHEMGLLHADRKSEAIGKTFAERADARLLEKQRALRNGSAMAFDSRTRYVDNSCRAPRKTDR